MYVWGVGHKIRPLHRDLQWSIVLPLLINFSLILHLKWNVGLYLWGRHSSDLVPWRTGTGDEILNKLWPRNHVGCVWLIRLLQGTFRKWGHLSNPVWKGVILGDNVLKVVLPPKAAPKLWCISTRLHCITSLTAVISVVPQDTRSPLENFFELMEVRGLWFPAHDTSPDNRLHCQLLATRQTA
jgi:hypothetical protein